MYFPVAALVRSSAAQAMPSHKVQPLPWSESDLRLSPRATLISALPSSMLKV